MAHKVRRNSENWYQGSSWKQLFSLSRADDYQDGNVKQDIARRNSVGWNKWNVLEHNVKTDKNLDDRYVEKPCSIE